MTKPIVNSSDSETVRRETKYLLQLLLHDLRNPLVNMQALTREMSRLQEKPHQNRYVAEEMAENLLMLSQSVNQMSGVLDGVNGLSNAMLESVECEEVNLDELAGRVQRTFADDSAINLSWKTLPTVWADPLALKELLESLLRYLGEGICRVAGEGSVSIHITAQQRNRDVELSVASRVDGDLECDEGLYQTLCKGADRDIRVLIAKALMKAHGGSLRCEQADSGICFFAVFPEKRV